MYGSEKVKGLRTPKMVHLSRGCSHSVKSLNLPDPLPGFQLYLLVLKII